MGKKIITNACIVTMNPRMEIIPQGCIYIEAGKIQEIVPGGMENLQHGQALSARGAEITDARGMTAMPGFVNTHTHLPMTMLRGYADDLPLHEWLTEHIFPAEARLVTEENVRLATRLALVEMIKSGTTCFNDMYFFEDAIAEEASRAGMRGVVGGSLIDLPAPDFKTVGEGVRLIEALAERWQGDPLITPGICAHSAYTCSAETLQRAKALADKHATRLQIHVAETRKEVEDIRQGTGTTPVRYLDSLGILDSNLTAAHCVWLDPQEAELLARRGTSVAHCPKSNLKLASGIADTASYLKAGVNVAIGTDGTASNNTLDMVEEMRFAALLAKGRNYDPTAVDARTALRMATLGGAEALGLDGITGSLEPGKRADLLLVNLEASNTAPVYDICSALVYAMNSKNIRSTMVEGRWLMKDRLLLTLDKDAVLAEMRDRFELSAG